MKENYFLFVCAIQDPPTFQFIINVNILEHESHCPQKSLTSDSDSSAIYMTKPNVFQSDKATRQRLRYLTTLKTIDFRRIAMRPLHRRTLAVKHSGLSIMLSTCFVTSCTCTWRWKITSTFSILPQVNRTATPHTIKLFTGDTAFLYSCFYTKLTIYTLLSFHRTVQISN